MGHDLKLLCSRLGVNGDWLNRFLKKKSKQHGGCICRSTYDIAPPSQTFALQVILLICDVSFGLPLTYRLLRQQAQTQPGDQETLANSLHPMNHCTTTLQNDSPFIEIISAYLDL